MKWINGITGSVVVALVSALIGVGVLTPQASAASKVNMTAAERLMQQTVVEACEGVSITMHDSPDSDLAYTLVGSVAVEGGTSEFPCQVLDNEFGAVWSNFLYQSENVVSAYTTYTTTDNEAERSLAITLTRYYLSELVKWAYQGSDVDEVVSDIFRSIPTPADVQKVESDVLWHITANLGDNEFVTALGAWDGYDTEGTLG